MCCCRLIAQSCLTLCDPLDCSPPGSSVHGILQARILAWVAMPSPPGDLPDQGIKPGSPALQGDFLLLSHQGNSGDNATTGRSGACEGGARGQRRDRAAQRENSHVVLHFVARLLSGRSERHGASNTTSWRPHGVWDSQPRSLHREAGLEGHHPGITFSVESFLLHD